MKILRNLDVIIRIQIMIRFNLVQLYSEINCFICLKYCRIVYLFKILQNYLFVLNRTKKKMENEFYPTKLPSTVSLRSGVNHSIIIYG